VSTILDFPSVLPLSKLKPGDVVEFGSDIFHRTTAMVIKNYPKGHKDSFFGSTPHMTKLDSKGCIFGATTVMYDPEETARILRGEERLKALSLIEVVMAETIERMDEYLVKIRKAMK
jgi:hypothetical protein